MIHERKQQAEGGAYPSTRQMSNQEEEIVEDHPHLLRPSAPLDLDCSFLDIFEDYFVGGPHDYEEEGIYPTGGQHPPRAGFDTYDIIRASMSMQIQSKESADAQEMSLQKKEKEHHPQQVPELLVQANRKHGLFKDASNPDYRVSPYSSPSNVLDDLSRAATEQRQKRRRKLCSSTFSLPLHNMPPSSRRIDPKISWRRMNY